jgi:hypothetical protein
MTPEPMTAFHETEIEDYVAVWEKVIYGGTAAASVVAYTTRDLSLSIPLLINTS